MPPPDSPVTPKSVAPDVGQRLEEIERADRVPELQAAETQPPQVLAPAAEGVRELAAVVVADHVVREHDEALAREADRAARAGVDRRVFSSRPLVQWPCGDRIAGNGPAPIGR